MPRLRREVGVRTEVVQSLPQGTQITQNSMYRLLQAAFNREYKKIASATLDFRNAIPNFKDANSPEQMRATLAEFREQAIRYILYVINANENDVALALDAKDYKFLAKQISSFYKNDELNISLEAFKVSGEGWLDMSDYETFRKGLKATNSLIDTLTAMEKVIARIDKPRTFFSRNSLSLGDSKVEMQKIIDKLLDPKKPIVKFFNALSSSGAPNRRVESAHSSVADEEEETAGNTLPAAPQGTATAAPISGATLPPRSQEERPPSSRHRNRLE